MDSPITENDIFERKEELMVSATGGIRCKRIAHFLKPIVSSPKDSKLKLPFLSPKSKWPLDVAFNGWLEPLKKWSEWVDSMHSEHSILWKKAGILEPILASKYKFHKVDGLFFGIAERWNCDTNTFVFPWGESTITLEDIMILGGFSVLGVPVFSSVKDENISSICRELSEVLIKKRFQTHLQWLNYFKNNGKKHEHEAFISLWLSMFVFPGTDRVGSQVIPIAVSLVKGTKIALAPAVLASIYRDMNVLKVSMNASTKMEAEEGKGNILAVSLWAPLYLVQIWVWERFVQFRPEPNPLIKGDPRVARWHDLKRFDLGNVRPILTSSGDVFLWRPYCLQVDNWPFPKFYKQKQEWTHIGMQECLDMELESYVRCMRLCDLVGVDCEEPYYPHRVAMQFGFDQDIPESNPCLKSGVDNGKPLRIASKLELPPRLYESDVSTRYLDWWRNDVLAPHLESIPGLTQKKRSFRHARKHITNVQKLVLDVKIEAFEKNKINNAVDMDVPPGFSPKTSSSKLENGRFVNSDKFKIKIEELDLDVPHGILPLYKIPQIQETEEQQQSNESRIVANEVKDSSNCDSDEAVVTVRASRILQQTTNDCFELNPQSLNNLDTRLDRIEKLLFELKNQMTKPETKSDFQQIFNA